MLRFVFAMVVAICSLGRAAPSQACSLAGPNQHQIDPAAAAVDRQAPTMSAPAVTSIERHSDDGAGCGSGSSCGVLSTLIIETTAVDDMTRKESIGYRVTLVSGALPAGTVIPSDVATYYTGQVVLFWSDPDDDYEPFDATLQLVAVDRAGNESAPHTVRAQHPGSQSQEGGCRIVSGRAVRAPAVVLAILLGLVARGRRRRAGR